jgi:hypothetical protein
MDSDHSDGAAAAATMAQILLKQGEMGTQLAIISEQLKAVPDHEQRIRVLEQSRARIAGAAITAAGVGAAVSAIGTWIGHVTLH